MPFSTSTGTIKTRNGVRISPNEADDDWRAGERLVILPGPKPAAALDKALARITTRYGDGTADVVAMQLEYPGRSFARSLSAEMAIGTESAASRRSSSVVFHVRSEEHTLNSRH